MSQSCCGGNGQKRPCCCQGAEEPAKRPMPSADEALKAFANSDEEIRKNVSIYYGKILKKTSDLKTNCCTAGAPPTKEIRSILAKVPDEVMERFYGCGNSFPAALEGLSVLDLGCGAGRDCYVCAALVGSEGEVTGVDMTDEQLDVARRNVPQYMQTLGYKDTNLHFVKGYIEDLIGAGIPPNSTDLVISNCVVNLTPNKKRVLQQVWEILRPGGEFFFSDVYASRRFPKELQENPVLWGECISGALYIEDFKRYCREVGFADPRMFSCNINEAGNEEIKSLLGEIQTYSVTWRLFKIPEEMEDLCEDYGQVAIYKGTIPGHPLSYTLDMDHVFEVNKPVCVCGNTAAMLGSSYLARHFTILGDRSVHYGRMGGSSFPANLAGASGAGAKSCSGGGCCC